MAKPRSISAKPLSVLLSDVFSDAYAKQGFAARELVTRWADIAGPEISAHSEPLKMQWPRPVEGQPQEPATLILRVEGPMALEIQHSSDVILQRVNRFFGWSGVGRPAFRAGRRPPRAALAHPAPGLPCRPVAARADRPRPLLAAAADYGRDGAGRCRRRQAAIPARHGAWPRQRHRDHHRIRLDALPALRGVHRKGVSEDQVGIHR